MILFLIDVLGAFLSLREHRKGKRFISEAASVKTARNPQIGEQSVCILLYVIAKIPLGLLQIYRHTFD